MRYLALRTRQQAIRWGNQTFAFWRAALTAEESSAILAYKTSRSMDINSCLRFPGKYARQMRLHLVEEYVLPLDRAIKKGAVPRPLVVYRAIADPRIARPRAWFVGGIYGDGGFLSTTLLRRVAVALARRHDNPVLVRIRIPAGTNAAYVSMVGSRRGTGEFELLLARGTKLRLLRLENVVIGWARYPGLLMEVVP